MKEEVRQQERGATRESGFDFTKALEALRAGQPLTGERGILTLN